MRKRHSKVMRATRRHVRREVGIGIRPPADHDEVAGEVAEQNVVLDLRVLCGTGHAEAHVSVRGSMGRAPYGLNVRLPDTHVAAAAAVFSSTTVDILEILTYFCALGPKPPQEVSTIGMKRVLPSSCSTIAEIVAAQSSVLVKCSVRSVCARVCSET